MTAPRTTAPRRQVVSNEGALYRIFIRQLIAPRPGGGHVVLDIDADARALSDPRGDRYKFVVCYDSIVKAAKARIAADSGGPIAPLAEEIANRCLDDPRVMKATVRARQVDQAGRTRGGGVEIRLERPPESISARQRAAHG